MKNEVILELARKLEEDAANPSCEDGSEDAKIPNAIERGKRAGRMECAEKLRALVSLLG
jgi:hypothetical protein